MIHKKTPVTLAEVKSIVDKMEEKEELKNYLKTFTKLNKDKADKLFEELKSMKDSRLKDEDLVKIVDFLPKDAEELRKLFHDTSLSEDEANAILEIVKKH